MVEDQFVRTELLLGSDAMRILGKSKVAVFGVGGVGGYVTEALARSGVGAFELIDRDVVSATNLNRQIIATWKHQPGGGGDAAQMLLSAGDSGSV